MSKTKIAWAEYTWNLWAGCTKIAAGCKNCAAESMAVRLAGISKAAKIRGEKVSYKVERYERVVEKGRWKGKADIPPLNDPIWTEPLRIEEPSRIFPCFMSDLFHETVPDYALVDVFEVMKQAHWHTFLVLTKRPERAAIFFDSFPQYAKMPNVYLGVSCSTQADCDRLSPIPAIVRWLSLEPLLEPIDMQLGKCEGGCSYTKAQCLAIERPKRITYCLDCRHISPDGLIVGCESGPRRRPCKLEWVRDIVRQCREANVPCFVKQIDTTDLYPLSVLKNKVSHNPDEWPKDLRVREYPIRENS